ncbi:MAG: hypothetical protein ACRC8P_02420 [Spiroplasma sp.]
MFSLLNQETYQANDAIFHSKILLWNLKETNFDKYKRKSVTRS